MVVDKKKVTLDEETINKMKAQAKLTVSAYRTRDTTLFARFREMYFMEDENKKPTGSQVDENDWAVTVSPSARNEVTGMVRLLATSDIHVTVKDGKGKSQSSDKIEDLMKQILRASGESLRARIEDDASLDAVLFGPVVMYHESLDDLLEVADKPYKKRQLEEIKKKTPVLIRVLNAEQSYPEWGDYGQIGHVWKYTVKGVALKDRWGVEADPAKDYTVYDYWDYENRLVWADNITEVLYAGPHGMDEIPVVVRYAGGTSLFNEPDKQLNSFLYAKAKSRLDKRENAVLTSIATAINTRGMLGPLLAIDPENVPESIRVDFSNPGVRTIIAKATQVDDKAVDPVMFQWLSKLEDLSGQSTVYKQTLGENINAGTFSGLAMLSSAGKLPLVDPQRAIEQAFTDVFKHICRRIKSGDITTEGISAQDIPDKLDIEVSLQPKLPQDQLRNSQIAQGLGDLVSDEWKHTELLNVSDSSVMRKQVVREQLFKAMVQMIATNPELMQPFIMAAMGAPAKPPKPPTPPTPMPTAQPTGMEQPQLDMMGQGVNMEQMPKTDAMIPPAERM